MKKYLIFYIAFIIVMSTDYLYGSLMDDLDSQEKKTVYTLKINEKIEKAYECLDSDVVEKDRKIAMLMSLPDCDFICVKYLVDKDTYLTDEKNILYKYHRKKIDLNNLQLDGDVNSLILSNDFKHSNGTKDANLPDNNEILSVVPEPSAVLLGAIGVGIVGWLKRQKAF